MTPQIFNRISTVLIIFSLTMPVAAMAYAIQWSPFK